MGRLVRRLLTVLLLAVTLVLFTAVPAQAAQRALDSGAWDLAAFLAGVAAPVDVASPVLPLVMGSIVILAALSSSSGRRDRDRDRW
jgi:hypothetical protein